MRKARKIEAGGKAVGAGGGTLVVFLAKILPENSPLKPYVLFAAPTVAVGLSVGSTWVLTRAADLWQKRVLASELKKAREAVQKGLQTSGTSSQHKAGLRKQLEELDRIEIDNSMNRIRSLASQPAATGGASPDNPQV